MIKRDLPIIVLFLGLLQVGFPLFAAQATVPEPFREFDPASSYTINYAELNAVLKKTVVDVGRSDREKANPTHAKTGTRMKAHVKRSTVNEGNRFTYEIFGGDPETQQVMLDIQKVLEAIPSEAPLKYFSRDEQLAYWLNLYNVTLINQVIKVYPKRKLKKLLEGKDSILKQKLLNVSGVPLSLDDIQYTILMQNYNSNPLVMYGLYQGIIGGPNIRKSAYTADNVQKNLKINATEFINSNRGTYPKNEEVFRASSLYDRNRDYFPNFQQDLRKHLLTFLEGQEKAELEASTTIKPDISDWTVTDLYGSYPELGGSLAENSAALLDSIQSVSSGNTNSEGQFLQFGSNHTFASNKLIQKSSPRSYVSPELIIYLQEIKLKQETYNQEHGEVTVEELGEVPVEETAESGPGGEEKD